MSAQHFLCPKYKIEICSPADPKVWDWSGPLTRTEIDPPTDPVAFIIPQRKGSAFGMEVYFLRAGATYWHFITGALHFNL